jgi:hypothetical protein
MSRKTEVEADLKRIGYQLGGAHLTRQARSATFNTFAKVMRELATAFGPPPRSAESTFKHSQPTERCREPRRARVQTS